MPILKGYHRLGKIFIQEKSTHGKKICQGVDTTMAGGSGLRLRSPLLKSLDRSPGYGFWHKHWLLVEPKRNTKIEWWFRGRDIIFSALLLGILSPLLWLAAILVKISSPGPVFYKTRVVGQGGHQFIWRKFRSMTVLPERLDMEQRRERFRAYVEGRIEANSNNTPMKIIDDKRLTPVGRIIRRYSIDELPQLWNVLRGHMSLVGPRPCLPYEAKFYTGWRHRRFSVPPGVTGVWQVFGRGRVGFEESADMDAYYAYCRSFRFDLRLILKTALVILTAKGAK